MVNEYKITGSNCGECRCCKESATEEKERIIKLLDDYECFQATQILKELDTIK